MPRSKKKPLPKLAHSWRFEAIGTDWSIDSAEPLDAAIRGRVSDRIEAFDAVWSRFRTDSLVSRIAAVPGTFALPDEAAPLFALYGELFTATDAAVNPLIGRSLEQLGYDASYSLRDSGSRSTVPSWSDALAFDGRSLTTVSPVVLDIGAAGKGLLVDLVCEILRAAAVGDVVVDAGGDMRVLGAGSTRVGLEHPLDPSKVIGVVELSNGALCASASNRRAWGEGLHHVLDATTGLPTHDVIATWVLAPGAMVADGLATAMFFATADRLGQLEPFEWVRMFSTGRVEHSTNFNGELFV